MPRGEDNILQVARRKHKLCRKPERIFLPSVESTGHIVTTCIKVSNCMHTNIYQYQVSLIPNLILLSITIAS